MDEASLKAAVSGGYIEAYSFDLLSKTFSIRVEVLDSSAVQPLAVYEITCVGCRSLQFQTDSDVRWERIQLMDIWVVERQEDSASESWKLELSLWDTAQLSVECAAVHVNDEQLR